MQYTNLTFLFHTHLWLNAYPSIKLFIYFFSTDDGEEKQQQNCIDMCDDCMLMSMHACMFLLKKAAKLPYQINREKKL